MVEKLPRKINTSTRKIVVGSRILSFLKWPLFRGLWLVFGVYMMYWYIIFRPSHVTFMGKNLWEHLAKMLSQLLVAIRSKLVAANNPHFLRSDHLVGKIDLPKCITYHQNLHWPRRTSYMREGGRHGCLQWIAHDHDHSTPSTSDRAWWVAKLWGCFHSPIDYPPGN